MTHAPHTTTQFSDDNDDGGGGGDEDDDNFEGMDGCTFFRPAGVAKIRYKVPPKLLNFMAPLPDVDSHLHSDRLFATLFRAK